MIEAVISGIGLGLVLSFVAGPVFFALIRTSIEKGFYAGLSLALGVFLSDIIYISLAFYGSSFILVEEKYRLPIGITGSVVLLIIGIYYLFKKVKINYEQIPSGVHYYTAYFLKGFLMCIFNPAMLLYWISVTSSVISVTGKLDDENIAFFFGSILLTQLSLDILKAYYANKMRKRIKESTVNWLNRIAGILMIIFALRLVYNLLFTHSLL